VNIRQQLVDAKTVAIIGCSRDPYRASNHAANDLLAAGYSIVPVNPKYDDVNGVHCYDDLAEVPDAIEIDIVNIFRNSEHTLEVVRAVEERAHRTGRIPLIWTQPGVSSPEAELAAIRAGIPYLQDRCIMVELAILRRENQDNSSSL